MSRIKEFPTYITNYDNIESQYGSQLVSNNLRKLNLDSVFRRDKNHLINIEHHSSINQHLMRRDYEYAVNLHFSTGETVEPFIFYTGPPPKKKIDYLNDTMFFNPKWFITHEIDGNIRLNNILYKKNEGEDLNVNEILDYIWLPRFRIDMSMEELILKLTEIYPHIHSQRYLLDILRDCLMVWIGKYIKNTEDLNKIYKRLNMSALEIRSIEEDIRNARIVGELERAEAKGIEKGIEKGREEGIEKGIEKGREEGIEEGIEKGREEEKQKWVKKIQLKDEIIKKLMENQNPEELSKLNIPEEEIQKYSNNK